jgi:sugar lactone lactonase YvrE
LLRPLDDVATALADLKRGDVVTVVNGAMARTVTLQDSVPIGHKFAVRDLADRLRIRKYGEFIGRTTRAISTGAWVHDHNLETGAQHGRHGGHDGLAFYDAVEPANVLRVIGETCCHVGENALYDAAQDAFWWIDVRETPAIRRIDMATGRERTWPMREDIGSIALTAAGDSRLLAALRSGFAWFDSATGTMTPIHDPEPGMPHTRLNDGKCDPAGRYWCGSMNPESGTADGSLYVLDHDLVCTKALDDFVTPNGMTWSLDGRTMYLADTRRGFIYAFEFDPVEGKLGSRRVFADLSALAGGPDGATLDAEGYLWSAQIDGKCLIRYAPDGKVDRVVRVPVTRPTSCAFGGPGYRTLFVTSATRGMSADEMRAEPDAGRVLMLDVGVGGTAPVRFEKGAASIMKKGSGSLVDCKAQIDIV